MWPIFFYRKCVYAVWPSAEIPCTVVEGFRENMNHSANRSVRLRRDATRLAIAFPEANAIFRGVQRRSDVVRRRYVVSANASFVAPIDTPARGRQLHRTTRSFVCAHTSRRTDVGHSFKDADDFCELLADKKSGGRTTASNLRRPHNVAAY